MIERPENHIAEFAKAGADSITIHDRGDPAHQPDPATRSARRAASPGSRSTRAPRRRAVAELAGVADLVLCMTRQPGLGRAAVHRVLAGQGRAPARARARGDARGRRRHRREDAPARSPTPARRCSSPARRSSAPRTRPRPTARSPQPPAPPDRSPAPPDAGAASDVRGVAADQVSERERRRWPDAATAPPRRRRAPATRRAPGSRLGAGDPPRAPLRRAGGGRRPRAGRRRWPRSGRRRGRRATPPPSRRMRSRPATGDARDLVGRARVAVVCGPGPDGEDLRGAARRQRRHRRLAERAVAPARRRGAATSSSASSRTTMWSSSPACISVEPRGGSASPSRTIRLTSASRGRSSSLAIAPAAASPGRICHTNDSPPSSRMIPVSISGGGSAASSLTTPSRRASGSKVAALDRASR